MLQYINANAETVTLLLVLFSFAVFFISSEIHWKRKDDARMAGHQQALREREEMLSRAAYSSTRGRRKSPRPRPVSHQNNSATPDAGMAAAAYSSFDSGSSSCGDGGGFSGGCDG